MHRLLRTAALASLLTLTGYLFACDTHTHAPTNPDLAGVVYTGNTTDEALEPMLDTAPIASATKGAQFETPAEGVALPATPTALTWHTLSTAHAEPAPHAPRLARVDWQGWLGVTDALAHGSPLSGTAYFLVVSSAKDAKLLRVFTAAKSYTPNAAEWKQLAGAGALTATVLTATFDVNKLVEGPFAGTPVHFTVKP